MVDPVENTTTHTVIDYAIASGNNTWHCKSYYAAGVQPKGSKGTNYNAALSAGSTSTASRTIVGVYPIFATTANISLFSKQALQASTTDITVALLAESGGKQAVRIPTAHSNIVSLQQFNTLSGQWDNIDLATFTITTVDVTVNDATVSYKQYTHNGATIGARQLKFKV